MSNKHFQLIVLREDSNQPQLVEFLHTNSYTYWHYHGNSEVHATDTVIKPFSRQLAEFCFKMKWQVVANVD